MISYIRTFLKFGLCRISVYSGFGLNMFRCICISGIDFASVSTISIFEFRMVPTVWYFRMVPTVWYFLFLILLVVS